MIGPDEHACPKCGKAVSNERTELIGTDLCVNCTPQKPKPKAIMDYSHKTAGVLMICDDERIFKILKKPINKQR